VRASGEPPSRQFEHDVAAWQPAGDCVGQAARPGGGGQQDEGRGQRGFNQTPAQG
jgi:hypothetical protein